MRVRIDGLTIVAVALIFFMGLNVLRDGGYVEAAPVDTINTAAMGIVPLVLQQDAEIEISQTGIEVGMPDEALKVGGMQADDS